MDIASSTPNDDNSATTTASTTPEVIGAANDNAPLAPTQAFGTDATSSAQ